MGKYEARGKCYAHPDEMAETIFHWQAFAMDITDPREMSYVTTLLVTNESFKSMLHYALKLPTGGSMSWARDAAGVIICLLALLQAGLTRLGVPEKGKVQKLFEDVMNRVLEPFEKGTQTDGNFILYRWRMSPDSTGGWQGQDVAVASSAGR